MTVRQSAVLTILAAFAVASAAGAAEPLPSWNDGTAKDSVLRFVAKVTKEGSPDFAPPAERIAAFGNSDGDLQMLEWTAAAPGPRFCLYVHHTDAEREWAYDRASGIGRLDKGLDEAEAKGWTVADMKTNWKHVFAFEKE